MRIKDIALIGMLSAILFAVQAALRFLPNIELVSLLIIIYTIIFRKKTVYIIGVFVLLEGLLYGFGLWWIDYLYIWYILYLLVLAFHKERSPFLWAVLSGAYGLSFGALCSIPSFFLGFLNGSLAKGLHSAFSFWISGIPYDIFHGIGNFFIALLLFHPLLSILEKLSKLYFKPDS